MRLQVDSNTINLHALRLWFGSPLPFEFPGFLVFFSLLFWSSATTQTALFNFPLFPLPPLNIFFLSNYCTII